MRLTRTHLILFAVLPLLLPLLQGCAGTARGTHNSAMRRSLEDVDYLRSKRHDTTALVVLRFPSVIETDAEDLYYRAFERHAIGGEVNDEVRYTEKTEAVADALLAKSNYFAMSLYNELRSELPPDTVLLSPHAIIQDGLGGITTRPLLSSEEVPTVLTIDFSVYSFPDPTKMMDSKALTFGDTVTSLVSVHTSPEASPTTKGLLIVSEPLVENAWDQSRQYGAVSFDRKLLGDIEFVNRPIDFTHFLSNGPTPEDESLKTESIRKGKKTTTVKTYKLEKVRMDGDLMVDLEREGSEDPYADAFARAAAERIVAVLNQIDEDRATLSMRQTAVARFDPELAKVYLAEENESVRARLGKAEQLLKAERNFLAQQSESIYHGVSRDVLGPQMKRMLTAEYELLQERRSLARKQNVATAVAILGIAAAGVSAGYGIPAASGTQYVAQQLAFASSQLMISSMLLVERARTMSMDSAALGENFLVSLAPELDEHVAVQVDWLEGSEEITARSFNEFHDKALSIYQRSVRSIDLDVPTDCAFRHPGSSLGGRWYGECLNGLASGSGRGVVRRDDGGSIEYFGSARNGVAEGVGYMILDAGRKVYEGEFAEGVPNGAVLVTKPGKKPSARRYERGEDAGRASLASVPRAGG